MHIVEVGVHMIIKEKNIVYCTAKYKYSENYLKFGIKSVIILLYIYWELGIYILFTLEIMKGGFYYGKWKFNNHFRLKHSDVFSAC